MGCLGLSDLYTHRLSVSAAVHVNLRWPSPVSRSVGGCHPVVRGCLRSKPQPSAFESMFGMIVTRPLDWVELDKILTCVQSASPDHTLE